MTDLQDLITQVDALDETQLETLELYVSTRRRALQASADREQHQIIVTCDDCGLSEGINDAALDLHQRGIVTNASIVMNFPAADHAFAQFTGHDDLKTGVHLNLTEGRPLTHPPAPSPLTDSSGRFRSREFLFAQAVAPTERFLRYVEAECEAQIEAFLRSGHRVDHLTTHMHFHIMPALAKVVFRLAEKYAVDWVRAGTPQSSYIPLNLLWSNNQRPDAYDIFTPDHEVAVMAWLLADPAWLAAQLRAFTGVTEVIVHAATDPDPTFPPDVAYAPSDRVKEVRYLEQVFAHLR